MSSHTFRNPDLYQQLPERDWIRSVMPEGRAGFVAEDLDLVTRTYGPNYNSDAVGRLMMIELKHAGASLGSSKENTFGMMDALMRSADPRALRYRGFFVIRTADPDWSTVETFQVNSERLNPGQFVEWLSDRRQVRAWQFPVMNLGPR